MDINFQVLSGMSFGSVYHSRNVSILSKFFEIFAVKLFTYSLIILFIFVESWVISIFYLLCCLLSFSWPVLLEVYWFLSIFQKYQLFVSMISFTFNFLDFALDYFFPSAYFRLDFSYTYYLKVESQIIDLNCSFLSKVIIYCYNFLSISCYRSIAQILKHCVLILT